MIPVLFPYTATPDEGFVFGSLGRLNDAISCEVVEAYGEYSYQYTLEMTYPVTGRLFSELTVYNIILAVPSQDTEPQAFRIRKVTRPIGGIVKVYADHISYDLDGLPICLTQDMTGASEAIRSAGDTRTVACPFHFSTNIPDTTTVLPHPEEPLSSRKFLLMEGGVQDTFGGEWEFNNNIVSLVQSRGVDSGLTLRRGKNISGLEQEETNEESWSGIMPYWSKNGEPIVLLPEFVLTTADKYVDVIAIVDFSGYFKNRPTVAQLRAQAQKYLAQKIKPQPTLSTEVDFVLLSQTLEYKDLAAVESLHIYDTVHVLYDTLGIDVSAKVCKTVYDVLLNRYKTVDIGATKQSLHGAVKKVASSITKNSVAAASGGTTDYEALTNKPSIENVTLSGNKTFEDLNLNALTNHELLELLT